MPVAAGLDDQAAVLDGAAHGLLQLLLGAVDPPRAGASVAQGFGVIDGEGDVDEAALGGGLAGGAVGRVGQAEADQDPFGGQAPVDAATRFPHFELGNLFKGARKVRGLDALRYRAQVARAHAATAVPGTDSAVAAQSRRCLSGSDKPASNEAWVMSWRERRVSGWSAARTRIRSTRSCSNNSIASVTRPATGFVAQLIGLPRRFSHHRTLDEAPLSRP
ncbi:hypothetical protein [Nocardia sp. NPDC051981]|uniref:hypothetical protein n=1 Tax=Nocardia sp. NPDC051981 TaxID=3155417 RepID=UPI003419AC86